MPLYIHRSPSQAQRSLISLRKMVASYTTTTTAASFPTLKDAIAYNPTAKHCIPIAAPTDAVYTTEVDGSKKLFRASSSAVYRHRTATKAFTTYADKNVVLGKAYDPEMNSGQIRTLTDMFNYSTEKYHALPYLGKRVALADGTPSEFQWKTYGEVSEEAQLLATALENGIKVLESSAPSAKHGEVSPESSDYKYEIHASARQNVRVGILSANSPEYMIANHALARQSFVGVPLYDTLGASAVRFILHHADIHHIFVSDRKLGDLVDVLTHKATVGTKSPSEAFDPASIRGIFVWDTTFFDKRQTDDNIARLRKILGDKAHVMHYKDLLELGKTCPPVKPSKPSPHSISTLMYTSGTTADPKGVLLTHDAILSNVSGDTSHLVDINFEITPGYDSFISYLPLAHIFDRVIEDFITSTGARIGYWRGDIGGLMPDIQALKPTMMAGVPRVFERIYNKIRDDLSKAGFLKNKLVEFSYKRKLNALKRGAASEVAAPTLDKIVFSKAKQALGGNLRVIVSGGAPLAASVEEFLKVFMCSSVVQGYGLTETCAASMLAIPDDWQCHGTVGVPTSSIEFKLESVPEMGYDATSAYQAHKLTKTSSNSSRSAPRIAGEVLFRGRSLFKGYYRDDEKTNESMDEDGWFHTGDIAELSSNNGIRIIDRKKNIFKLAQGEYIAVEKLELVYGRVSAVEQIWVYGNSFEHVLVAVVVPQMANFWQHVVLPTANQDEALRADILKALSLSEATGLPPAYPEDAPAELHNLLCTHTTLIAQLNALLNRTAKESGLKGFELLKRIHVEPRQGFTFNTNNDLLTATFKLRRPQLLNYYKTNIDHLYQEINKQN